MKLTEIRFSSWINSDKTISPEQTCTSFDHLSRGIRSQQCLKSLEWIRIIKYNGIKFIFTNLLNDNGKDFTIAIYDTHVFAHFIMNRPSYGKRFWANFHKKLRSICDQMIIFQIHNQ